MRAASYWGRRAIEASKNSVTWLIVLLVAFFTVGALVRYSLFGSIDYQVTEDLQKMSVPGLDQAMILITHLGDSMLILVMAVLMAAFLFFKQHFRAATFLLMTPLSMPIDGWLKSLWGRERPDNHLVSVIVTRGGYSFPSGHAMGSTTFYGFLAVLAWIHLREYKVRRPAFLIFASIPIAVSISRVYTGAHWFSDILGGVAFGLVLVLLLTMGYRRDKGGWRNRSKPTRTLRLKALALESLLQWPVRYRHGLDRPFRR